jgi:hypothetical protein
MWRWTALGGRVFVVGETEFNRFSDHQRYCRWQLYGALSLSGTISGSSDAFIAVINSDGAGSAFELFWLSGGHRPWSAAYGVAAMDAGGNCVSTSGEHRPLVTRLASIWTGSCSQSHWRTTSPISLSNQRLAATNVLLLTWPCVRSRNFQLGDPEHESRRARTRWADTVSALRRCVTNAQTTSFHWWPDHYPPPISSA